MMIRFFSSWKKREKKSWKKEGKGRQVNVCNGRRKVYLIDLSSTNCEYMFLFSLPDVLSLIGFGKVLGKILWALLQNSIPLIAVLAVNKTTRETITAISSKDEITRCKIRRRIELKEYSDTVTQWYTVTWIYHSYICILVTVLFTHDAPFPR